MNFKKLSLLVLIAILASCVKKEASINGHWHRVFPEYHSISTLDIGDTLTITDQYSLHGYSRTEYPRIYNSNYILPVDDMDYTGLFFTLDDTLFIKKDGLTIKYVKSNLKECIYDDRYINRLVSIALDVENDAIPYQDAIQQFCLSDIFVGKLDLESAYSLDSLSRSHPDSIFIQVQDVLINLVTLPKYVVQQTDICSPRTTVLSFHLDKGLSKEFITRLRSSIPDSLNLEIRRVVKMFDGDIGLKSLD